MDKSSKLTIIMDSEEPEDLLIYCGNDLVDIFKDKVNSLLEHYLDQQFLQIFVVSGVTEDNQGRKGLKVLSRTTIGVGPLKEMWSLCARKIVDPVRSRVRKGAVAAVLLHNRLNGDATPDKSDIKIIKELIADAGEWGKVLFDYIIVADNKYFSMREAGML
ncbi:hypothetical protein CL633_04105 [bacterium]|nr:hypothetical protein [bacterium]|tara:strand:+ start:2566 stop:3048 length:483 start_codon:yes stop_codon:yes gene_type:complete